MFLIHDKCGFHLHLFDFPFVYQFYFRMTTLVESTCWNPAEVIISNDFKMFDKVYYLNKKWSVPSL